MKTLLVLLSSMGLCTSLYAGVPKWLFSNPSDANRQYPKLTQTLNGDMLCTYNVTSGTTAQIFVTRSTDDGLTWIDAGNPGHVPYNTIGLQRQPTTISTSNGALVCAWESPIPNKNRLGIYSAYSTNNGVEWSTPELVTPTDQGANQDFSSVTAGPNGLVYVSYLTKDAFGGDNQTHVFLARSTDNGASWNAPVRVDSFQVGGSCECCIQNVVVSPSGRVAVSFRANLNNIRDIYVAFSDDEGQNFKSPIKIQDEPWTINGCPSTGPNMVFDATETLHLVWRDARDIVGRNVAYYSKLKPGASVGSQNIDLSTQYANEGEYPSVCTNQDGSEIVVVLETSRGLHVSRSSDGGKTFAAEVIDESVVRAASAYAVWTSSQGPVLCWRSDRDGRADIRLANGLTSSINETLTDEGITVRFSDGRISLHGLEADEYHLELYDMLGSRLFSGTVSRDGHSVELADGLISNRAIILYRITLQSRNVIAGIVSP